MIEVLLGKLTRNVLPLLSKHRDEWRSPTPAGADLLRNVRFPLVVFFLSLILFGCHFHREGKVLNENREIYNVRQFGAKGDGIADDSEAFQKALDAVVEAKRAALYIPPGKYLLREKVVAEFTGEHGSGIAVYGEGKGVSTIICENTEGALKIRDEMCVTQVYIHDLSFFAGIQGAGTAIEVSSPKRGVRDYRTCTIENVEVKGAVLPTRNYFDRGYAVLGQWRPLLSNCIFSGVLDPKLKNDPDYNVWGEESLFLKPEYGFCADWSYAPSFQHCYAWCCDTGYRVVSVVEGAKSGPEDLAMYRCFAVGCRVGVHIDTPNKEPQLLIDGCHINCRDVGILLRHRKFFHIVNCLMYSESDERHSYTDISLYDCFAGRISGNIFHSTSPKNLKPEPRTNRIGIEIQQKVRDLVITDNIFHAKGVAVAISENARGISGANNRAINAWTVLPDELK